MYYTSKNVFRIAESHQLWIQTYGKEGAFANLEGVDLTDLYLTGINLSGANLRGADLTEATLKEADLSNADLRGAILKDAVLSGANFTCSNLSEADLTGAYLERANLTEVNLSGALMAGANLNPINLTGTTLRHANFDAVKKEFFEKNDCQPNEVAGLRKWIIEGRIDGGSYEGLCCCYVGSLERLAGRNGSSIKIERDALSAIEILFTNIIAGDTPFDNPVSALVLEWIDEWLSLQTQNQ